jgi:hypothetical protein
MAQQEAKAMRGRPGYQVISGRRKTPYPSIKYAAEETGTTRHNIMVSVKNGTPDRLNGRVWKLFN